MYEPAFRDTYAVLKFGRPIFFIYAGCFYVVSGVLGVGDALGGGVDSRRLMHLIRNRQDFKRHFPQVLQSSVS